MGSIELRFWPPASRAARLLSLDSITAVSPIDSSIEHKEGIALADPPPSEFLAPTPEDLLVTENLETLAGWRHETLDDPTPCANRFCRRFIVLSGRCMLHDLHLGSPGSKREAPEWAKNLWLRPGQR